MRNIPVVDVGLFLEGSQKENKEFVQLFGESLKKFGFVLIENHNIAKNIIKKNYENLELLFALSNKIKKKYVDKNKIPQRGYFSLKSEKAKNSEIYDFKEFWHFGREIFTDPDIKAESAQNIWPEENIKDFKKSILELYSKLDTLSSYLLAALSEYLNLPKFTLVKAAQNGNSVLRTLHYPPLSGSQFKTGELRAAEHEDINLLTILPGSTDGGLEIKTSDGKWLEIDCAKEQMIVDSGDMLSRLTNNIIPATTHRVVNSNNSKNISRYSMPFFVHTHDNYPLSVFESCVSPSKPNQFSPILAKDFLLQRLYENGLCKKNSAN